jgi:hypothetical protein
MTKRVEADGFRVRAKACATCIYRKDSPLDIRKLEADVADKYGGFKGHRVCHSSGRDTGIEAMCCRGFWNRHKDKFAMGQIAQRLGWVAFIKGD